MIYITGDTHGHIDVGHLSHRYLKQSGIPALKPEDKFIICGDFGFPFLSKEDRIRYGEEASYQYYAKWLSEFPCEVLYIDGNHDNHPLIQTFKEIPYCGGIAHQHPDIPNCKHLIRGEVYTMEGHTFLAFGGAASIDAAGRTEGIDWWPEEVASEADFNRAIENLKKHNNEVDYVLTHTMPMSLIRENLFQPFPDITANYLDVFYNNGNGKDEFGGISFKKWFCGHFHQDKMFAPRVYGMYYRTEWISPEKTKEKEESHHVSMPEMRE